MTVEIKKYPGYFVSNEGYVIGKRGKRIGFVNRAGYEIVTLCGDKGRRTVATHRIVAEYFVSGRSDEHNVVDHINGDKSDNRSDNLRWTSRRKNLLYAYTEQNSFPAKQRPKKVILHHVKEDKWYCFDSIHDASVKLGIAYWHLNDAYHGKRKRAYGYEAYPVTERERI